MKNITKHSGILHITGKLPNSYYGNPRYTFTIDGYSARTGVDSSHAYSITNYDGKQVKVTLGSHYTQLTLNTIERETL